MEHASAAVLLAGFAEQIFRLAVSEWWHDTWETRPMALQNASGGANRCRYELRSPIRARNHFF